MKTAKRQSPCALRIAPELKSWLEVKARENKRSLNNEMAYALERYRAQQQGQAQAVTQ